MAVSPDADHDPAGCIRELDGVVQQVEDQSLEPAGIAVHDDRA